MGAESDTSVASQCARCWQVWLALAVFRCMSDGLTQAALVASALSRGSHKRDWLHVAPIQ